MTTTLRNYRLEARLSSRETDNRNEADMVGWVATIKLPNGLWCQACGAVMGPLDPRAPWHHHEPA